MSNSPLSDLIDQYINDRDMETYWQFVARFRESMVGVSAEGGEQVGVSSKAVSTAEHPITMGLSETPNGQRVLLVFADPETYIDNYGMQFNAEIDGNEVLKVVMGSSDVEGVQVNSATREVSMIISRQMISLVFSRDTTSW